MASQRYHRGTFSQHDHSAPDAALLGRKAFHAKRADSTDVLVYSSIELLKEKGIVKTGDVVVATAGVVTYANRHSPAANTNIMRVAEVD